MGRPAEMWCGTTNVPWRLFIENEIDSVVRELHKNSRWTGIAKRAGIGALWTGGSRLPTKFICEQKGAMFEYPLTADGYVTPGGSDVTEECWRLYRSRHDMGKLGVGMGLQGYGSGEVEDYLSEFEKFSRLYGFLTLRERLCAMTANESLNGAAEILDPFLDIVRTGEATGPIARAALVSVGRLMNAGLLKDLPDEDVAMALLLVTQAVTNCQFEETDSATNESVLLEILNVLRLMMSSELSSRLTDEVVCKIIETVLSMSCQMRLSEILRKSAESALFELVSVVFCRLRYLAQSGGNVGQGRATGASEGRSEAVPMTTSMMNPPSTSDPVYSKRPARGQQQHSRPLTPRMERTRSEQSTTPEAPSVGTAGEGASAEAHYAPQYSPYSTPAILEVFSVLVQLLNPRDLKFTDTMRLMALNALIIAFNSAGSAMSGYSSFRVIALNSLCHHLLQILAGNQVNLIPAAFRLLTLLFSTHKKYCKAQIELFICQTVGRLMGPVPPAADYNVGTPNDNRESPVKQQAKSPTLDRQHSEHTLPKHPGGDAETLAMSFTSFEPASFKRLTYQEQLALYCAMSLKRGVRGKIASGQVRQLLLEGFHHMMTSDEAFLADLWVNYDCDHRHGNLCDFLVAFITHNAIPPTGGDGQGDAYGSGGAGGGNGSSGGGGDSWGASNEYEAYQDMLMYHIGHMLRRAQRRQHHQITKKENSSWLPPVERLLRQKKYKDDTTHAAMRFNQKPKEGIAYLQRIGYLPAENSSDMVAKLVRFLKQAPTLDKSLVGEYLAKPSNTEVLQTYISTFDFNDRRLEEALRMILGTFRLPGESQQIERIMETFATAFFETSPEGIATKDAAFVLAFAVIMLNTDQHSPQVKSRMKFSDFCRNLRGVNGGNDFSHEFLEATYEAIRQREIVFPEEHEGEAGFEYAWKEMWSRDEPMVVHSLDLARNGDAEDDSSTPVWLSTAAAASAEQYLVEYDSVLFKAMWPRLLSVAANTLVRSNCDYLLLLALQAYQCVAELGASYGDTLCMSTTVSHLVDVCGGMSPALIKDIDRPQILFVDEHGRQKVVDTNRLYLIDSTFPVKQRPLPLPLPATETGAVHSAAHTRDLSLNLSLGDKRGQGATDHQINYLEERRVRIESAKTDWVEEIESEQRKGAYTLTEFGLQLGKDYPGQLVLILLFDVVRRCDFSKMGEAGWSNLLELIYLLVNADLLPLHSLRISDKWMGESTLPRRDMLYRWERDYSLGRPYYVGHSACWQKQPSSAGGSGTKMQGGGLFSALSMYFGGGDADPGRATQPAIRWENTIPRRYLVEFIKRGKQCVEVSDFESYLDSWDMLEDNSLKEMVRRIVEWFPASLAVTPTDCSIAEPGREKDQTITTTTSVAAAAISNSGMAGSARANDPGQQDIVSAALQYDPGQLFFMERVVAVVRKSGARVLAVWSVIEKGFERILEHADSQPPYVVERTVSGILDLALTSASAHADSQGHSEHEEVLERIFQCLGLLRDVSRVTTFTRVADYIAIGLYDIAEANPSILLTKKNWSVVSHLLRSLANVGDQVIYPSPAQQVGFEIVLRLAKAITDGKVPPSHLAPVIDTLQEYIPPSRLFKMIGGGSCDKQVSETVGSGGVDAASLPIHVQVANQEAARKTAAQVVSTIHGLGEYIKREHLRSQTQPPDRQLIYQWIDLLSHLSKFSHDRQREIRNQAGSLLQQALIQTEFFEPDPAAPGLWALEIFAKILFPLFDRLQRFDYLADFQMEDAHTRTISTLVTFFLHHLTELQQYQAAVAPDLSGKVMSPRSFDRDSPALHHQIAAMGDDGWTAIWFRIVGILVRYIEVDHLNNVPGSQAAQEASNKLSPTAESEDGRQQHVPMAKMHQKLLADIAENNLKNIVLVADSTGVFRDGDGSGYNQLWRDTFGLIDPVRPGLKHTLFPDTEPPKSESEPQSQPTNLAYLDVGIQRSPQASASPPLEDTPLPDTGHDVYHQGPDRTVLLSTDSKISGLTEKSDGYTPKEKPRSSVQQQQHHQHQGGSKRKNLIIMPEDSTTDHEEV